MGIAIHTSLLVDRSPETGVPQQARITLDDGTTLDVCGHNTYWGPRFVVTAMNAKGTSREALAGWVKSEINVNEQREGWRTFCKDRKQEQLMAEWLRNQVSLAVKEGQCAIRVNSDKMGDSTITVGARLVGQGVFGYRQVVLGVVDDITII